MNEEMKKIAEKRKKAVQELRFASKAITEEVEKSVNDSRALFENVDEIINDVTHVAHTLKNLKESFRE